MRKFKIFKNQLFSSVFLFVSVLGCLFLCQACTSSSSPKNVMVESVDAVNETCPKMIDGEIRLDSLSALSDKEFQYNYTLVDKLKDSIDIKVFEENAKAQTLKNLMADQSIQNLLGKDIRFIYNYKDKDGTFITEISVPLDVVLNN